MIDVPYVEPDPDVEDSFEIKEIPVESGHHDIDVSCIIPAPVKESGPSISSRQSSSSTCTSTTTVATAQLSSTPMPPPTSTKTTHPPVTVSERHLYNRVTMIVAITLSSSLTLLGTVTVIAILYWMLKRYHNPNNPRCSQVRVDRHEQVKTNASSVDHSTARPNTHREVIRDEAVYTTPDTDQNDVPKYTSLKRATMDLEGQHEYYNVARYTNDDKCERCHDDSQFTQNLYSNVGSS